MKKLRKAQGEVRETNKIVLFLPSVLSSRTVSIIESLLCVAVPGLKEAFKTASVHNRIEVRSESSTGGCYGAMHIRVNADIIQTQWTVFAWLKFWSRIEATHLNFSLESLVAARAVETHLVNWMGFCTGGTEVRQTLEE